MRLIKVSSARMAVAGLVVWSAVCAAACAAWGQAPIERRTPGQGVDQFPTLKAESRLVNITVNAVDANGSPVGGLTQADFAVKEDGKAQTIAFFDKESKTPLSVVLAVDGSESVLTNERLEKDASKKFVKALIRTGPKDADELDLIAFSDSATELVSFTNDVRRIGSGLDSLPRGAATAMYDAVFVASKRLGETSTADGRRRVLVMITDGGDTTHGVGYERAVAEAQRNGVAVYPLIVVPIAADAGRNTGGEHALIQMAADTGGKYYYVLDPKELPKAFAKLSDDLRTQYVVGYYAPVATVRSRRDGFRAVAISLTDPLTAGKVSLRYRAGYYGR